MLGAEVEGVQEALALDCDPVPLLQDQPPLLAQLAQKLCAQLQARCPTGESASRPF